MAEKPKHKPLEVTMHADTKAVDVFLFDRPGEARDVFPDHLRPPSVLVALTQDAPRETLRGRMVRNCYWLAGGNGTWSQEIQNRLMIGGQIHVLPSWDGLRKFSDADTVGRVLDAMHVALINAPRPLQADELRSVLEQHDGR